MVPIWVSPRVIVCQRLCILASYNLLGQGPSSILWNKQQKETLKPHLIPGLPWEIVGKNDLFDLVWRTH